MKQRLSIVLSATALAVAALGSAPVAHAATQEEFVPFVTDFPKSAADPAVVPAPPPTSSTSGVDWADVGIGGGIGAALATLLAGTGLVLTRRTRPARG